MPIPRRVAAALTILALALPNPVTAQRNTPTELRVPVRGASLYARIVGEGTPVIVLHGGPDFDSRYLLPDLDRLGDIVRLIYYDQRGRGKSANDVAPDDVTLASDINDLDRVRQHFGLQSTVLLGHSWGAVLALEYALRYPGRVSHLILMNPAPVSASDLDAFRKAYVEKLGTAGEEQRRITGSEAYLSGDPATVVARYRIHFKHALSRTEDYDRLMEAMAAAFVAQGAAGILKARAVEHRLMLDTWRSPGYDLLPRLRSVHIPAIIITGEQDFIPTEISNHIAEAIPGATLVTLRGCGHFVYLECPAAVHAAVRDFIRPSK